MTLISDCFFHISKDTYSPIRVKQWVYEALKFGNRTVEYKRPCVRVQYHRAGEEAYHVDFAVYSEKDYNWEIKSIWRKALWDHVQNIRFGKFQNRINL